MTGARDARRPTPADRGSRPVRQLATLLAASVRLMWTASRYRTVVTLGVQIVTSLSLFVQVLLIKWVLDAVLLIAAGEADSSDAAAPVAMLAGLTAATSVAATVASLQQRVLGELVAREVWRRVLAVSGSVELRSFEDPEFHDQTQRVQANGARQTQVIVQALVMALGGAVGVLAGVVAVLALAAPLLPLLLLSGVPLFLTARVSGRNEFAFSVAQTALQRERSYLQRLLIGREEAKEVRAFSLARVLQERLETKSDSYIEAFKLHVHGRLRLALLGNIASAVLVAGALLAALFLVDRGDLSISSAGAALVAVRLLGGRVGSTVLGITTIYEAGLFLDDLQRFLQLRPAPAQGLAQAPSDFSRLSVRDLTFTYPHAQSSVLKGVSVDLCKGEVIALVGANGSGKTTLAKIIANLYEPTSGQVLWDEVDVRAYEADSVRRRISVLFQDFVRYKLTAHDNVALGRVDVATDRAAVQIAALEADADGFVSALPNAYDTVLSKEFTAGADLSLGQWQRVALARAFVRKEAPLLILDEPSASLDARAEYELFQRVRSLMAGRTVLLISHRFSSVRSADRIYVMAEGRVIEQGDHDALMALGGVYAELFELQARAYLEDSRDTPVANASYGREEGTAAPLPT